MRDFELKLKLQDGAPVVWSGRDGEDASRNYALSHPGAVVLAWRTYPRYGLFAPADIRRIVEPGDKA